MRMTVTITKMTTAVLERTRQIYSPNGEAIDGEKIRRMKNKGILNEDDVIE